MDDGKKISYSAEPQVLPQESPRRFGSRGCLLCHRMSKLQPPLQFGEEKTLTDIAPLNEIGELESEWFLSFSPDKDTPNIGTLASRCTSFVVTARTIAQIAEATKDDNVIVHSEAIERTEANLRSYRKMIEEAEKRMIRISGGDRLSQKLSKDEDTARRHSRELLGGDSRSGRITEEGLQAS